MAYRKQEATVSTVEGKMPKGKRGTLTPSERVERLPKVTLKRRKVPEKPDTTDLENRVDNIILE